jgi:O-acetyl-ADP-ribose deacetylase (regulator of RNase III)
LGSAYRRSLEVASEHGLESVAFPSISTGAYGYPVEAAARVALAAVIDYLGSHPETSVRLVRFVLHGRDALRSSERALTSALRHGANR